MVGRRILRSLSDVINNCIVLKRRLLPSIKTTLKNLSTHNEHSKQTAMPGMSSCSDSVEPVVGDPFRMLYVHVTKSRDPLTDATEKLDAALVYNVVDKITITEPENNSMTGQ